MKTDFARIQPYAPHRPPMVWIDEVLEHGLTSGVCMVRVRADAHYMGPNGMRASSFLEFIAQAYGYMSIAHRIYEVDPNAQPLKRAFLASIKGATFCSPDLLATIKPGDELQVRISGLRQLGAITMFNGEITRGSESFCKAQMKVFSE